MSIKSCLNTGSALANKVEAATSNLSGIKLEEKEARVLLQEYRDIQKELNNFRLNIGQKAVEFNNLDTSISTPSYTLSPKQDNEETKNFIASINEKFKSEVITPDLKIEPKSELINAYLEKNNSQTQSNDEKVKQLRAEEKVEMAATDDTEKRKEIYDKYDKLITPLLKDSKVNNKGEFFSKDIIQETKDFLEKELDIKYEDNKSIKGDISINTLLNFSKKYGNPIPQKLAKILENKIKIQIKEDSYFVNILKLSAFEDYNYNQTDKGVILGTYNSQTSQISINLAVLARYPLDLAKQRLSNTINHEIIHHFTLEAIEENDDSFEMNGAIKGPTKFQQKLNELFDIAKKANTDNKYYYGLTNTKEFVTESLTNAAFQQYLATIPYAAGEKTLWKRFLEILSDVFKQTLGKNIDNTLLKEIINILL